MNKHTHKSTKSYASSFVMKLTITWKNLLKSCKLLHSSLPLHLYSPYSLWVVCSAKLMVPSNHSCGYSVFTFSIKCITCNVEVKTNVLTFPPPPIKQLQIRCYRTIRYLLCFSTCLQACSLLLLLRLCWGFTANCRSVELYVCLCMRERDKQSRESLKKPNYTDFGWCDVFKFCSLSVTRVLKALNHSKPS